MNLNTDNLNIISFGIEHNTNSEWLFHVNNSTFSNRIYCFFNPGVSCVSPTGKVTDFKPGNVYFVPSNALQKFYLNTTEPISHFHIDFSSKKISFSNKIFKINFDEYPYFKAYIEFFVSYCVHNNIDTITYNHLDDVNENLENISNTINHITCTLLSLFSEKFHILDTVDNPISFAVEYIQEHFNEKILLDDLCKVVNLSKNHFIRKFKAQYGMTPHHYISWYKMLIATNMIKGGHSICEIANTLGYESVSSFSRAFKKHYGFSLLTLKNNHKLSNTQED